MQSVRPLVELSAAVLARHFESVESFAGVDVALYAKIVAQPFFDAKPEVVARHSVCESRDSDEAYWRA